MLFDINVNAAFTLCRAAAPAMKRAGGGRIVNTSSGAGLQPSLTGIQAYCAAKHAVVGLTRQLAHEFGPYNITVNSVAPGFIRTNAATEKQWESYGPDGQKALVERIAMKRLGTAQDIANAVVFFASDLAGFVNGQILQVDGVVSSRCAKATSAMRIYQSWRDYSKLRIVISEKFGRPFRATPQRALCRPLRCERTI